MNTQALLGRASLVAALWLSAPLAHAQDVAVSDSARQHFKTGVAYLTDPDGARYEDAYREFKAAYADSPSWKILGNLGITSMKLERDGEAIDAFEKYLSQGGAQVDPAERAQMERDVMTTKAGLVWVTVHVAPANAALTDERQPLAGRPVANFYPVGTDGTLRVGIRRGHHKITARATGFDDAIWEFDASPGPELTHEFDLATPKPASFPINPPIEAAPTTTTSRPISMPVIIGAAVTGGLLIGSGVVGVLAMGKKSDFNDLNDGQHIDEAKSARDSGKTLNIVGDVLLGGAVVGAAVTTYLFINRPEVASGPRDTASIHVVPTVSASGGGLFMTGRF
jgi:hypothetical protein